jgi:phosphoribosylformylglycinamidine synthase subunit PurQ / glutaminase
MTQRLVVIQFPGSNCEYETAKAAAAFGFDVDIKRWTISEAEFMSYDGYILPGGFSFQDRVRAGVVSAKLQVVSYLEKVSRDGKAILGICNGCQILAETGLVPDIEGAGKIEIALAPNTRDEKAQGFTCDWVNVKPVNPEKNIFLRQFDENDVIPIPINHGEGHFVLSEVAKEGVNQLASLRYCTSEGLVDEAYPINPNGTYANVAGLSNVQGNVFAVMPHPERATFLKQVPLWIDSEWSAQKRASFLNGEDGLGPWSKLFTSMSDYISTTRGVYANR